MRNIIIIALTVAVLVLGGFQLYQATEQQEFNSLLVNYLSQQEQVRQRVEGTGFIYDVTNSSTSIGQTSTNVVTSTQQWHWFKGSHDAVAEGNIWCSLGEAAVVGEGQKVASSSPADDFIELNKASLTTKPLNCIADVTSTLSWSRF